MSRVGPGLIGAAALLLALAACGRPAMPPFERTPVNPAIAAALGRLLAAEPACRPFAIGAVTVWQYPLENHTNVTSYDLDVDADVVAVRRLAPAAGDVASCFGTGGDTPTDWPVGAGRPVRTRGWLAYESGAWTLKTVHEAIATLPPGPLHAFRLGLNGRPAQ